MFEDNFLLEPHIRAEDVILGSLGYDQDATIVSISRFDSGYEGIGRWSDGETFEFKSEGEISELEEWALSTLCRSLSLSVKACA